MWKHLHPGQNVRLGDQLRYVEKSVLHTEDIFKVVKTEQHYFQIVTEVKDRHLKENYQPTRIIRYFEIGYNVELEVWTNPNDLS
jgi:hypothetical protein